ncbi:MAG: nucleotidyltransferase family protein [Clostridiales bacterium]|nr:nucleotidyltransferase family protein [Clostridiales bacterium]
MEKVGAILLAAGNSRRFGSNKLLHLIEGKPMAQRCMELAQEVPFEKRVIVTQYQEVEEIAASLGIPSVRNSSPELGISHSILLGIRELEEMDAWMFLVCDQPWLKAGTVRRLLKVFLHSSKGIAAVSFRGEAGNPVIFSRKYREELENLTGDRGGKKILLLHPEDTELLETEREELEDMDEL